MCPHTDEQTLVHNAQSFLAVNHQRTNRGQRTLTQMIRVNELALVATAVSLVTAFGT